MKKRTKIIATVGPTCQSFEKLRDLVEAGVDIFRLNFSHGTHEWHGEIIKKIKRLNKKLTKNVAILLDTKGPEIRTGDVKTPIEIKNGEKIILTPKFSVPDDTAEGATKISVNYDAFVNDVEVGEKILVDNGVMSLKVLKKTKHDVECEVLDGGTLGSRRHLNLPGKDVSLESITKKDWNDISFGIEMGVDFIALSFVRTAEDVLKVRKFLKKNNSKIDIIAKIESFEATKHLGTITEVADGIMIARGDLGAEIPFAKVPQVQEELIHVCADYKKPVIVATHMLESMIENPIPTRAEVTDIFEAVMQRTDCTMLSGETAAGNFPTKSVEAMQEVIVEAEKNIIKTWTFRDLQVEDDRCEFAKMAARMADELPDIEAILVITRSGLMANMVSNFRPRVPIFAFTNEPAARRKMQILWGVEPFRIDFSSVPQKTITRARKKFVDQHPEYKGKKYILISDFLVEEEFVPTLQIREF
ncbi:MAG: pyruvate kinase [Candidatus Peregrinibacteria bacterium]|nr:pyruvate kinase [Candidatus Peregrinibacteria bacterium]